MTAVESPKTHRGTSNSNARGSAEQRRRRREWLVEAYRANVDAGRWTAEHGGPAPVEVGKGVTACRCYRCGCLLTVESVTVDRIIPGCKGGTYRRDNIRPACGRCNSQTGACLGNARRSA